MKRWTYLSILVVAALVLAVGGWVFQGLRAPFRSRGRCPSPRDVKDTTLSASWLAVRHGADPIRIERRRRAGELLAVRDKGGGEWRYPMWQFDDDGEVRPVQSCSRSRASSGSRPRSSAGCSTGRSA